MRFNHRKQKVKGLRKKKKLYQRRVFWVGLLLIVVGGATIYFLIFMPFFQARRVEIAGTQKIQAGEIETLANREIQKHILGFNSRSIFLSNHEKIEKNILRLYPGIETAKVQKKYPDVISITITERQPSAVFCSNPNHCFSIDNTGVVFEIASPQSDAMIISSEHENAAVTGQTAVDKRIMEGILKIRTALKQNFAIDITEALAANPLVVKTSEQWKIYFDPAENIDFQIAKMNALLKDEISAGARKNLQYMYLQYKDRAYYK